MLVANIAAHKLKKEAITITTEVLSNNAEATLKIIDTRNCAKKIILFMMAISVPMPRRELHTFPNGLSSNSN